MDGKAISAAVLTRAVLELHHSDYAGGKASSFSIGFAILDSVLHRQLQQYGCLEALEQYLKEPLDGLLTDWARALCEPIAK